MTVDWSRLHHAYGPASDIPPLLAKLSPNPHDPLWGELWSRICHQGTVYSASFAAIPALVAIASSWAPSERPMILGLASDIIAGAAAQREFRSARKELDGSIRTLSQLTNETLDVPDLSAADFVHVLQASLAFRDVHPWASQLARLEDEEFEAVCPQCETELLVAVGSYGFFVSDEDYVGTRNPKKQPIEAADPEQLSGATASIYSQFVRGGHPELARRALYAFGTSTCTVCGAHFDIPAGIALAFPAA